MFWPLIQVPYNPKKIAGLVSIFRTGFPQSPAKNVAKMILNVIRASTLTARIKGLLCTRLPEGVAMQFVPCHWIHTFFMKRAIDCLALDDEDNVTASVENLLPWRWCLFPRSTSAVLEMEAGEIRRLGILIGTRIQRVEVNAPDRPHRKR